jgi:hypothetical protein
LSAGIQNQIFRSKVSGNHAAAANLKGWPAKMPEVIDRLSMKAKTRCARVNPGAAQASGLGFFDFLPAQPA